MLEGLNGNSKIDGRTYAPAPSRNNKDELKEVSIFGSKNLEIPEEKNFIYR